MTQTLEMPSRTDDPETVVIDHPPVQSHPSTEQVALSTGEISYLRALEDKNRLLTMMLGDKLMEVSMAQTSLTDHRETLREAYLAVLNVHGATEGRIDTSAGTITLMPKA